MNAKSYQENVMYLGCHVGMKAPGYFEGSIKEALSYGADACMIYTGAPQNSKRKPVKELKIEQGRAVLEDAGWKTEQVIVHAPYIINLANMLKPETAYFGREFLKEELRRTAAIGARYLVLHPGSHLKQGAEEGIRWVCEGLDEVFESDSTSVEIALESMAGKGSEIGCTFEEIRAILDGVKDSSRLKVCLDTCHLNDAGYDVSEFDTLLDQFDEQVGLERLAVLHVNDSKNPKGARKDRHENIGKGTIGLDSLGAIVHNPRLSSIIKILETPYIDDKPPYADEIALLRAWHPASVSADETAGDSACKNND